MAKATVVSIVPFEIKADKISVHPGNYRIPKSDGKNFEILVVGEAFHDVYLGADRSPKNIRVTNTADNVARAIVEDFLGSQLGTAADARPGIFWKSGEFTKEQVKREFAKELIDNAEYQHKWYLNLVRMADDDWQKSNHKHTAISDLQRFACKTLGLEREWLSALEIKNLSDVRDCPVCTLSISVKALKCPHCGVILNQKEYEKYSFAGVK